MRKFITIPLRLLVLKAGFLVAASPAWPQLNLLSVDPAQSDTGVTDLLVTTTFDSTGMPPAEIAPTSMSIGSVSGDTLSRDGVNVSALFDFPQSTPAGEYDVTVVFPAPSGEISATLPGAFRIGNGPEPQEPPDLPYAIVDTGQSSSYNAAGAVIPAPAPGEDFYGQDAQVEGYRPSYEVSQDGLTVYDRITRLTWVKSPDLDGDGTIDSQDKLTADQAEAYPATLNAASYGGYSDWRLPSIKELYSLMDFRGYTGTSAAESNPYLDDTIFDFAFGDEAAGERFIDSQWATTSRYVSTVMNGQQAMFGVNFADGRIKGYPVDVDFYVRCVRGNPDYGQNDFVDNGDGTVTDRATGLMWTQQDTGEGLNWQQALARIEQLNAANHLGHSDWRLPNVKELHSLTDYTRSPDTTGSPAIDPIFTLSTITDEGGGNDFPFVWSSTTHVEGNTGDHASYVAFGEALGFLEMPPNSGDYTLLDVHGAGAQRSDPKDGDPADYPVGFGPQGDVIRIFNYVLAVRDAPAEEESSITMWAVF